jgi:heme-degrading monooxygenase HmoA
MVVTLFRNRLRPDAGSDYDTTLKRMLEIVRSMPGYISHKTFIADDGERCTVVEFDTEEHQRAWATNAEHVQAKVKGRSSFYSEYSLQICNLLRESRFPKA